MEGVSAATVNKIAKEFLDIAESQGGIVGGGLEYAKSLILQAMDKEQAEYIIENLTSDDPSMELTIMDALRNVDPDILADFIKGEHPQTIAIIVAYMQPEKAAVVLGHLGQEMKNEIIMRVAELDQVPSDVLSEVAHVITNELHISAGLGKKMGGAEPVAEILNQLDSQSEKDILAHLEEINPGLVDDIRKLMFVFEDLASIDDRGMQQTVERDRFQDAGRFSSRRQRGSQGKVPEKHECARFRDAARRHGSHGTHPVVRRGVLSAGDHPGRQTTRGGRQDSCGRKGQR